MDVKGTLKLIQEGASMEELQEASEQEDRDLITEAVMDIFISETNCSFLTESATGGLDLVGVFNEAASDSPGFWSKLKQNLGYLVSSFDPYDGIRQLRLVNELIKDDQVEAAANRTGDVFKHDDPTTNKQLLANQLISATSLAVTVYSKASKYKNFDPDLAKKYIKEAEIFHDKLVDLRDAAIKAGNKTLGKRYNRQANRLHIHINTFESRAINKAKFV
jgi:hypothetical protein